MRSATLLGKEQLPPGSIPGAPNITTPSCDDGTRSGRAGCGTFLEESMISTTPQVVVGPFTDKGAGAVLRAASAKFGPVNAELAGSGSNRTWLLLQWPKGAPDNETRWKVLGYCHGVADSQE